MKRLAMLGLALVLTLAACGGSGKKSTADTQLQTEADSYAIDQIEKTWHKAASTQDVDLMMTHLGARCHLQHRHRDAHREGADPRLLRDKAGPFQPGNHWVSDTPAYKVRITVNGDKGTLYFECHYIDVKTGKVASVVAADQTVQRIGGKWLITSSAAAAPALGA